jgi:signal transduction histidine kinase
LRATCERVLAADEQQERLIEALLTLARSQRGLDRRSEVDLGTIAAEVTREVPRDGVRVSGTLGRARAAGDPSLVERLVANLVQNAVLHNQPGGWVNVWTGVAEGRARLRISNSGPVVRAEEVGSLVEPFRRLNGERSRHARGLGVGLSIVSAIGLAHGAEVGVAPRAGGGLDVEVAFPPV